MGEWLPGPSLPVSFVKSGAWQSAWELVAVLA